MARKLKVFAADLGFVRAVVAAPSRKAALEAWGVHDDLFARGSAREITDDTALMEEAQASPGEVMRKPIAAGAEIVAAAAKSKGGEAAGKAKAVHQPATPAPSRDALDRAEAAFSAARDMREAALKVFDEEQADLDRRREAEAAKQDKALALAKAKRDKAKSAYDKALKSWAG